MGQVISSTPSTIQISVAVLGSLVSIGLYKILAYAFRRTELTNLPGPKRGHILFGNMKAVIKAEPSEIHALWEEEYGHVYVYHGLGNVHDLITSKSCIPDSLFPQRLRLFTSDVRALAHILQRTDIYHKPASTQQILGRLLGWGVLVAEGEQHRVQRKALNPAFGPGQLRDLTGIFLDKANEVSLLIALWAKPFVNSCAASYAMFGPRCFPQKQTQRMGIYAWMP
jgi:cytochrome P450